jgi:hypothetical protein
MERRQASIDLLNINMGAEQLWDCVAKLMHVLACAAAGFEVMTVSFRS